MTLALPKGSLVLVTGATGYLGSWTTYEFIKQGYRVRAGVRSQEKAAILQKAIEDSFGSGHLEIAIVTDFASADGFAEAIKGVDAIVHLASDVSLSPDPDKVVKDTVNATKSLLNLARKTPSVKRFTLTSSSVAISIHKATEKIHYNDKLYNEESVKTMYEAQNPLVTYAASKTLGEQAFWENDAPTPFVRNAVLPSTTIGPTLHDKLRGSTHIWLRGMYHNDPQNIAIMQMIKETFYVSVLDIAKLHVGATIFEEVKDQRLLGFAGKMNFNGLLDLFKQIDPEREFPEKVQIDEDLTSADAESALKVLRLMDQDGFVGYEESVKANVAEGLGW